MGARGAKNDARVAIFVAAGRNRHHCVADRNSMGRVLLCAAVLLAGAPARAQNAGESRWLFVPVFASAELRDGPAPTDLTAPWEAAMQGATDKVVLNSSAASLVEAKHSSEPVRIDPDRLSELERTIDAGQNHLAMAERKKAAKAMQEVQALSAAERDFLRREPMRARKLFDICMMTVSLLLREKQQGEAEKQLAACADAGPGFFPPQKRVPPDLQELVRLELERRKQSPSGALTVTSTAAGCAVRLNGSVVGSTPAKFEHVPVGIVHVQIECDASTPGRTHALTIEVGDNHLDVDPAIEAALRTRDALWFEFATDAIRQHARSGIQELLTHVLERPRIVLLLIDKQRANVTVKPIADFAQRGGLSALRFAGGAYDSTALSAAVRELRAAFPAPPPPRRVNPQVQFVPATAVPAAPTSSQVVETTEWPEVVVSATGIVVGVSGFIASWVLYAQRQSQRLELQDAVDSGARESFAAKGTWTVTAGAIGAVSLSVAVPFLLPEAKHMPTWAWVAGASGVAIALVGLGYSLFGEHCGLVVGELPSECRRVTADVTFGPLVALHALPFLAIPTTYVIRGWTRPSGLQVSFEGGLLSARGQF
jgi:hypothetical protein